MAKDAHQNIREVIEEIVDLRLKRRVLSDIADVFEEVLVQVKENAPIKDSERSVLTRGKKKQIHRVRHPKTNELVSREERDAFLAENPTEGAAV